MKKKLILLGVVLAIVVGCDPMHRVVLTTPMPAQDAVQILATSTNRTVLLEMLRIVATNHNLVPLERTTHSGYSSSEAHDDQVLAAYKASEFDGAFSVALLKTGRLGQYQIAIFEMGPIRRSKLFKSVEAEIRKALPDAITQKD